MYYGRGHAALEESVRERSSDRPVHGRFSQHTSSRKNSHARKLLTGQVIAIFTYFVEPVSCINK